MDYSRGANIVEKEALFPITFDPSPPGTVKIGAKVSCLDVAKELSSLVSCFAIIYFVRTLCQRAGHPRCFKKRRVGLQNLMLWKCYFQT